MDWHALFIAELNERLITHFTGGHWRVPLSQRHLPVPRASGGRLGRIVCADERDVARALRDLSAAGVPASAARMQAALAALAEAMRRLRREEGLPDPAFPPERIVPPLPPGRGPLVLMSAAETEPAMIGQALIAAAGRGVIWKPAPRAAASAHLLMRELGPLAAGRLALLQGDHDSGAALAAAPNGATGLIWASPAPAPIALTLPLLRLSDG